MLSCRAKNLVFKFYLTTNTLCVQGQVVADAKRKLITLLEEKRRAFYSMVISQAVASSQNGGECVANEDYNEENSSAQNPPSLIPPSDMDRNGTGDLAQEVRAIKENVNALSKTLNILVTQIDQRKPKDNTQIESALRIRINLCRLKL